MSDSIREQTEAVRQFIQNEFSPSFVGKVSKVQGDKINVKDGDREYFGVRLKSVVGKENGVLLTPVLGAEVLCIAEGLSKEQFVAVAFSELEKLEWKIGETTLVASKDGLVLNGGKLGGLIKIEELVKNLEKLTARVDAIYDGLAGLVGDAPQAGSMGLAAGLKAIVSPPAEDFSGIENDKIKHG